jgi:hypothetical protein
LKLIKFGVKESDVVVITSDVSYEFSFT